MTRVRVRSDGIGPRSTVHVVGDDGTETLIPGVLAARCDVRANHVTTAVLELDLVHVDVIGELAERPPLCGFRYEFRPHMACTLPNGHEASEIAHRLEAQA